MKLLSMIVVSLFFTVELLANPTLSEDRTYWISRVFRSLRSETNTPTPAQVQALSQLSDEEIVRQALSGPEFADTVLRFNLYFLGHSPDPIRFANGRIRNSNLEMAPSAFTSAREILINGDYAKLFDLKQPSWMSEFYTNETNFDRIMNANLTILRSLIDQVENSQTLPPNYCTEIEPLHSGESATSLLFNPLMREDFNRVPTWQRLPRDCDPKPYKKSETLARLYEFKQMLEKINEAMKPVTRSSYFPKKLDEILAPSLESMGIQNKIWSAPLGRRLTNTATNLNRRRSAYVLKHFFCENLTPLQLSQPPGTTHSDVHGDDPTCKACHYRLDPMAGFFRDFGHHFLDYRNSSQIRMDDGSAYSRSGYLKNWLTPEKILNVGYIREEPKPNTPNSNIYKDTPEDLTEILRSAFEVKKCLTQRWAEFLFGKNQMVDLEFLENLAKQLETDWKTAGVGSSQAIRNLVTQLVLSKTFRERNADPNQCYDEAFSNKPQAPCPVRFLLKKNCTSCHTHSDPEKKLDLTQWIKLPSGEMGFAHRVSAGGPLLDRKDSFRIILDRITVGSTGKKMPPQQVFPTAEKERFYKWLIDPGH